MALQGHCASSAILLVLYQHTNKHACIAMAIARPAEAHTEPAHLRNHLFLDPAAESLQDGALLMYKHIRNIPDFICFCVRQLSLQASPFLLSLAAGLLICCTISRLA